MRPSWLTLPVVAPYSLSDSDKGSQHLAQSTEAVQIVGQPLLKNTANIFVCLLLRSWPAFQQLVSSLLEWDSAQIVVPKSPMYP